MNTINQIYVRPNLGNVVFDTDPEMVEATKPTPEEENWMKLYDTAHAVVAEDLGIKEKKHVRPLCYISGPMMSEGHPYSNIGEAIELGEIAYERGWAPVIPHLDCLVSMVTGNTDRDRYMETDLAILSKCACVCVLPYRVEKDTNGLVTGTAEELDFAEDNNIPVYTEETLPWVN